MINSTQKSYHHRGKDVAHQSALVGFCIRAPDNKADHPAFCTGDPTVFRLQSGVIAVKSVTEQMPVFKIGLDRLAEKSCVCSNAKYCSTILRSIRTDGSCLWNGHFYEKIK